MTDPPDYNPALTPVVEVDGGFWMKRDDLYRLGGVCGGKVRACWHLCRDKNVRGLTTASHRPSPQGHIVSAVARRLGVPCRVHTPFGPATDQMEFAKANGAEIEQHDCGYNNVIIKRAADDARARGWFVVPFGMECREAVASAADQVRNVPDDARRIVIPVGSAISLAGVLTGMRKFKVNVPVLGVCTGADSRERLNRFAPWWRDVVELVPAGVDYHKRVVAHLGGVLLDPVYEAKCLPFLEPGDLLWCVGRRNGLTGEGADK